ncbi:hypothetical protein DXI23_11570 [Marinobacter flavimaris]|uniref:Uncharacterized protein n=1 Tax=Marinobacter flavimaris TaxID=262076 RepID=A0A3D8H2B2_9GAMM|nr:hypothetical protein [Marinobacter flavimaris]PPI80305.1 hypothetical protein MDHKLMBL_12170 [Marinobacter flavimaris]RDU40416.1 hypothetical protein DXI23_11570 [Marinobacter flavimaris]
MKAESSDVMNFIRRDGRAGAPVAFLTIEDGGENGSEEEFLKYIGGTGVWEPGVKRRIELGRPGDCISKIMSGLLFGSLENSANYRDYTIYLSNEWNLKFYPIGRPGQHDWQDYYSTVSGLTKSEYASECQKLRPTLIWNRYGDFLEQSELVVILASRPEWLSVLKHSEKFQYEVYHVEKQPNGPWKWAFFFKSDGILAFAYFGMFVRGVSNRDYLEFAELLRKYSGNALADQIPNMVGEFKRSIVP